VATKYCALKATTVDLDGKTYYTEFNCVCGDWYKAARWTEDTTAEWKRVEHLWRVQHLTPAEPPR